MGRRLPPRPRISGRTTALPKRRPEAKSAPSFEEERRARILHMKRLYGLGEPEVELQVTSVSNASATMSRVESSATLRLADVETCATQGYAKPSRQLPAAAPVALDADSATPDFDRALIELQASMDVREETHLPEPAWERGHERGHEDPLALSLSAESMGGSGGLIAWSKNLRPEDLSPDVTLSSFLLRPCDF